MASRKRKSAADPPVDRRRVTIATITTLLASDLQTAPVDVAVFCEQYNIPRRRVYDCLGPLLALNLVKSIGVGVFEWTGKGSQLTAPTASPDPDAVREPTSTSDDTEDLDEQEAELDRLIPDAMDPIEEFRHEPPGNMWLSAAEVQAALQTHHEDLLMAMPLSGVDKVEASDGNGPRFKRLRIYSDHGVIRGEPVMIQPNGTPVSLARLFEPSGDGDIDL